MLALVLALMLSAAPVEVEIHYMPPGTELTLSDGLRVKYFVLAEYKLLLQMDGELWTANKNLALYQDIDLKYVGLLNQKDQIIAAYKSDREVLDERLKRTEGLWQDAEKRVIANAGGPIWPYIVGAAGAVVGIVGATLWASTQVKR